MASTLWLQNAFDKGADIVVVGVTNGNKILTGRRRDNGLWTSPGGHMEPGEQNDDAAIREVLEESGIQLQPQDLKFLDSQVITSHRTGKEFKLHSYLANVDDTRTTTKNDPDNEISEWKWVDIHPDIPELKPAMRHAKDDVILNYLFDRESQLKNDTTELGSSLDLVKKFNDAGADNWAPRDRQHEMMYRIDNGPIWTKAKKASQEAFGEIRWPFVQWWYEHHGGK